MVDKPTISVLMSVFNETERVLRESVDSVLTQTCSNFELIIVCDNPSRHDEVKKILDSYQDSRIVIVANEKNIGLAMSMNKAAKVAHADIFARMDADDIAYPDRLQKEYEIIINDKADLVFSRYEMIDENSVQIKKEFTDTMPYYSPREISNILQYKNVIHHPTVMMKRNIFEIVGGYRDFPCSQDFDLWMRLNENGCKFYMTNESLLQYRVSENSTSKRKWLQQQLTCHYIFQLSCQRLSKGTDNYSKTNYEEYLKNKGNEKNSVALKLKKSERLLSQSMIYKHKGEKTKAAILRLYVFVTNSILRDYYINVIKKRIMIKRKGKEAC